MEILRKNFPAFFLISHFPAFLGKFGNIFYFPFPRFSGKIIVPMEFAELFFVCKFLTYFGERKNIFGA
jgi:hypothetical protein